MTEPSEPSEPSEEPPRDYAIRFTEAAARDLDAAFVWMGEQAGVAIADEWRRGLYRELATLATLPRRFPRAPEKFSREVRQLLYRRTGSTVAYRVLFNIEGEGGTEEGSERALVVIRHLRHGAARPLKRQEVRDLENEQA